MDQRRVDAFVELFGRVRDGQALPGVAVRRERELGLVLHADTFFGHGPPRPIRDRSAGWAGWWCWTRSPPANTPTRSPEPAP